MACPLLLLLSSGTARPGKETHMSRHISYPKRCSACGKDFDVEFDISTEDQWKQVQHDIWKLGTCAECYNTASVVEE